MMTNSILLTNAARITIRSLLLATGCLVLIVSIGVQFAAGQTEEDVAPVRSNTDLSEEHATITETALTEFDRDHWAFRPIAKPRIPQVRNTHWPHGSLDAFILARLEKSELTPAPEADRATLLRRLSFDLIGLPPTVAELTAFEADASPDAYERQVDRLLGSTAYGERWAQHWLDLARFAETDGFEHDKVRADAWKYRDWVIAALNDNMAYDRFLQLQIAGDELEGEGEAVATMFCLSGPDMPDINDQLERRHLMLNELTSTVGSVFLGLQFGCAECHDHKYDPVSQSDFYRLRSVFESSIPALKRDAPNLRLRQQVDAIPARFWIRGNHRRPGPIVHAAFPRIASQNDAGDVPAAETPPRMALAQWLVRPDNPLTARVIVNRVWKYHFGRGLFDTPSDVGLLNAEPSHPELLDWLAAEFPAQAWNLKWLHRQIVVSATYRQSSRNSHADPEWNRRLLIDADNTLRSRGHRRRLDGESLRDAMLAISGLITDERGGPGVRPPLPNELVETLLKGQWTPSPRTADHDRRSIYLFTRRNLRYPLFEVFDRPDANASCAARNLSTTPTQSLMLLNSALSLRAARHLAGQILMESNDPSQQIENLFLRAFSRHPSADEVRQVSLFLTTEQQRLKDEVRTDESLALPDESELIGNPFSAAAFVEACLAVLNASEMVYLD
jgi:hypothetical protein